MSHLQTVESIVFDTDRSVPEKAEAVISFFTGLPGRGLSTAAECLTSTDDERVASFVATHLQMLPGGHEDKTRAVQSLRVKGKSVVRAAARLVPWLPDDLLEELVSDYLSAPEPNSPRSSVLFSIALYRPDLVRPFAHRIESDWIQRSLLSGAPDELADAFFHSWKESDDDIDVLHALSLIRTDHAADLIQALGDELTEPEDWEALMALVGRLPEGGSSGYRPSFMGFVVDRGESPHVMGGPGSGVVPLCPMCQAPAEHVLTVAAGTEPFELSADAEFFWYSCDCFAMDSTTVRSTDGGRRVYFGPEGPAGAESHLIPGARAMALEPHPNQAGISLEAFPGQFLHQVGGLPRWVDADLHPVCPECGKSMPFMASVDGGHTPFGRIGFGGTLFCFWCDACRVSSTKYQA